MSITSYAQNFEDVMLWRALGHIERGFYVDVGAQDPTIDSVSRVFYEHGWRGIHVEPTPYYAEMLRQHRPGDMVIQAAVGAGPALLRFFEILDSGISTADPAIAEQHRHRGFNVNEIIVTSVSLEAIFDKCPEEIHWLKIDVEGLENQVLSSWGTSAARPWILVVESMLPLTQIESHESWEKIILGYGYSMVYFDGLNRFYVSDAKSELKTAFNSPPNVFDSFSLNGTANAPFHRLIEARHQEKLSALTEKNAHELSLAEEKTKLLSTQHRVLTETFAKHQQESDQAEQELSKQNREITQALEELRHAQEQRELEFAIQRLQAQQHAHENTTQLLRLQMEQERHLNGQHTDRIESLNQQHPKDLNRAHEITSKVLTLQQQIAESAAEQARTHSEQIGELLSLRTEEAIRSGRAFEGLVLNQAQRERETNAQLLKLHEQSSQEKVEHVRLLELVALQKDQLQTEIRLGHQASTALSHKLAEVQRSLDLAHASLSWRLTAPLRKLSTLFSSSTPTSLKGSEIASPIDLKESSAQGTGDADLPVNSPSNKPAVTDEKYFSEPIITSSPKSLDTSLPSLIQAVTNKMPTNASTLAELLAHHDQHFVSCAYHTLLGRAPDQEGLEYYLDRIRTGIPKIQILEQLRYSKEGREYSANLLGLDAAIQNFRKEKYPLIGGLFKKLHSFSKENSIERQLRVIENQMFVINNENNARFEKLDETLAVLHQLILKQTQSIVADLDEAPNKKVDNEKKSTPPEESEYIKNISARSRTIYLQLKKSADIHAKRAI